MLSVVCGFCVVRCVGWEWVTEYRPLAQLRQPLPRRSEPRVEFQRTPELDDGRLALLLQLQSEPEVVGVLGVARIAGRRLFERLLGARQIAAAAEDHAEGIPVRRRRRVQLTGLA